MKFQVSQDKFAKALSIASRVVSTRATLPSLSGIYLELLGNQLTLLGSNTETAFKMTLDVKGEEDGQFVVPAKLITDFAITLPNEEIFVEADESTLKIKTAKVKSDFTGLSLEEYPMLSFEMQAARYTLPAKEMADAIDRVSFAASTDEARAILTGVSLQVDGGVMVLAATDGFRLSVEKFPLTTTDKKFGVVIPAKVMMELGRALRDLSGNSAGNFDCALSAEGTQIIFTLSENVLLMTRILEGTFAPYSKIIPTSYATRVVFKTDELLKMVKTASLFARSGSPVLKLTIDAEKKSIRLSSATEQVGGYDAELDGNIEGSSNVVAFNARYIIDFISKIKSDEVFFEMNNSNQPGVWKIHDLTDFLHVIMPVRIDA